MADAAWENAHAWLNRAMAGVMTECMNFFDEMRGHESIPIGASCVVARMACIWMSTSPLEQLKANAIGKNEWAMSERISVADKSPGARQQPVNKKTCAKFTEESFFKNSALTVSECLIGPTPFFFARKMPHIPRLMSLSNFVECIEKITKN